VLAGSTSENAGFAKEVTEPALSGLGQMANEISPFLTPSEVTGSWAGLRPFVRDALPVLGPVNNIEGLTVATGHYRNGILLAPVTAGLIADLLTGGSASVYLDMFGAGRFQSLSAGVA
jgi:glycine/D-amino acid oxidase-like deaminating enzyme